VQMLLVAFSRRMCCSRAISAPDPRQIGDMLGALGLAILEALIDRAVPTAIRITEPLALSRPRANVRRSAICAACATATDLYPNCTRISTPVMLLLEDPLAQRPRYHGRWAQPRFTVFGSIRPGA
jgi:hypothetical protein